MVPNPARSEKLRTQAMLGIVCGVLLFLILKNAWVSEDAYISYRVVDNFVNGYGLRWNVFERVQGYTHPLWLLLHIPFYWITREIFLTTIAISTVLSVAACSVGLRAPNSRHAWPAAVAAIPLALSSSFLHYATSGLETPLTFFLLALFSRELLRGAEISLLRLSLVAAFAAVNRLDTILIFAPAVAYAFFTRPGFRSARQLLVGFLPLVAWELFSVVYYGFIFPNTRWAKLPANEELGYFLSNGLAYTLSLVRDDVVSACLLLGGLALGAVAGIEWLSRRLRGRTPELSSARVCLLGLGVAAYCAYIVYVGGDFMRGRMFTPPLFASALILSSALSTGVNGAWRSWMVALAVVLTFLCVRYGVSDAPWYTARLRITDERAYYEETNSIESYLKGTTIADHTASRAGQRHRAEAAERKAAGSKARMVVPVIAAGMRGYYAGPDVVLIDEIGLTDPLIARLGVWNPGRWRIGHPRRTMPEGYLTYHRRGSLKGMDPSLQEYYRALRLVVSGPLFAPQRWLEIVRLNLGSRDHLLRDYEARHGFHAPALRKKSLRH